jgi:hypothetical protein
MDVGTGMHDRLKAPMDLGSDIGQTQAERHAKAILAAYPDAHVTRTRDVIQLDIDEDRGCTVLITGEAAEIRLPAIEWTRGACGPRASSQHWKRVSLGRVRTHYRRLFAAIEAARAARVAEHQRCCFCQQEFPPEHMTADACHACASAHRGIVY